MLWRALQLLIIGWVIYVEYDAILRGETKMGVTVFIGVALAWVVTCLLTLVGDTWRSWRSKLRHVLDKRADKPLPGGELQGSVRAGHGLIGEISLRERAHDRAPHTGPHDRFSEMPRQFTGQQSADAGFHAVATTQGHASEPPQGASEVPDVLIDASALASARVRQRLHDAHARLREIGEVVDPAHVGAPPVDGLGRARQLGRGNITARGAFPRGGGGPLQD